MADNTTEPQDALMEQLLALLAGGNAHATLQKALNDWPIELRRVVPESLPYSGWQLLEHLRITQRDILHFSAPGPEGYRPLEWPKQYWPAEATPPTTESWDETVTAISEDAKAFAALITTPGADLYTPFPWGEGQNLLREALLLADHNSYHTGELVLLRRFLGAWT